MKFPKSDYVLQNFSLRALTFSPRVRKRGEGNLKGGVGKATDGDQLACVPKTVPVLAVNVPYLGKSLVSRRANIYT